MLRSFTLFACLATSLYAAPVSLFDGKTLDQWEGSALWKVVDGEIHGGSLTETVKHNDFIATKKSFSNFELKLKLRLNGTGFVNSGVQIRSLRVPGSSEMAGYQVDYGPGWYGKIYDESRRNKVIAESKDAKAVDAAIKPGEWNEYVIRAEGARIRSWINGVPALDYIEPDAAIAQDGHIGIQVHGGGKALIQAKDITIEELPATPGAPTWEKVGKPGEKKPKKDPKAYNGGDSGPKTPAEQLATFKLPDGLEMDLIASEIPEEGVGKFIAVYFDAKGAMWTMTALEYPVDGNENAAAAAALYKSRAKDKILIYDRDPKSPTGFVSKPRVFADGLAIPLGILPYKDGCYVQHGPDLVFLRDTDGDGKSDKREVILTGLGVQDSHLFPHQFTRAPGGWIWMAQGLFNNSKPVKPGDAKAVDWPQCSMAKMRPDGSQFEVTSTGPNNIWGLAMTAEGETFIQEANDYGYPVMPFHEYAYYPGGMEARKKSYQPDFPPQAEFRMGGTGLSGLALTDKDGIFPDGWRDVMLVANPITNRIQTIKMHRDGPRWKLEQRADIVQTTDSWFRPVALTLAPDGCVYVVDWYNKIISHNEVPRNHPDRDKTRGRIWRIKPKGKAPMEVPDFTKLSGDELIAKLGGASTAQHHMAWQEIGDRGLKVFAPKLKEVVASGKNDAARIGALWALVETDMLSADVAEPLMKDASRNIRREVANAWGSEWRLFDYMGKSVVSVLQRLAEDADAEVRSRAISSIAGMFDFMDRRGMSAAVGPPSENQLIAPLLAFARPSLAEPAAKASHGNKTIKVGEAYEREYERFLVRMFLERHPEAVAKFLETDDAKKLPLEARLLATLALGPVEGTRQMIFSFNNESANRPLSNDEFLYVMQNVDAAFPQSLDSVIEVLCGPRNAVAFAKFLVESKTKFDPTKKQAAYVIRSLTMNLFERGGRNVPTAMLLTQLVSSFKGEDSESALYELWDEFPKNDEMLLSVLRGFSDIGIADKAIVKRVAGILESPASDEVKGAALAALAGSKAADAPARVLALYPKLAPAQRRLALDKLTTTKAGASAVVGAVSAGTLPKGDIDAATLDRLLAVLGEKDAELTKLVDSLGSLFRPVLALDGTDNATIETGLTLDGAFTVETWVKLDEGISNADGILGAAGKLDMNFYGGQFRAYVFPPLGDVVTAKKATVPGMWQHLAATRDAAGNWKIYVDGELNATGTKTSAEKIEKPVVGWTSSPGGFKGQLAEFRIWKSERTADEIRASFDRSVVEGPAWSFHGTQTTDGTAQSLKLLQNLGAGARLTKTSDLPPVLTADAAAKLDADFAKYRALSTKAGDKERGKTVAALCQACHLFGNTGGQIGPNLSGVGAMGAEAILRNILTPNAAMESGYRIFRVEQRDGSVLDAFFVSEDKDAVIIRLPGAADQRIAKKNIVKTTYLRRSLMPEGLLAGMNDQQVSDLFAYLLSLK